MLASTEQLGLLLDITDESKIPLLTLLLQSVDAAVKDYTHDFWEQVTYTEYPPVAPGVRQITLEHLPVHSAGLQVWEDSNGVFDENSPAFQDNQLLTLGEHYGLVLDYAPPGVGLKNWSMSGILERLNGYWPVWSRASQPLRLSFEERATHGSVKVTYTAGFPAGQIPPGLTYAVLEFASLLNRTRKFGGLNVQSEGLGSYNYSLATQMLGSWPEFGSIRQMLAPWKKIIV